jgi:hypothetical protein
MLQLVHWLAWHLAITTAFHLALMWLLPVMWPIQQAVPCA